MRLTSFWSIFLTGLAFAFLFGCDTDSPEPKNISDLRPVTSQEQLLINNSNQLLFNVFREINTQKPNENLFFSPLSIGMALGMAYNGSEGYTKELISMKAGFSGFSDVDINKGYNELTSFIETLDNDVDIAIANSFWYKQGLPINNLYRDKMMAYFNAESEGIDFKNKHMTHYLSKILALKTDGKVTESVSNIEPDYQSFIQNVAYFSGKWAINFDGIIENGTFKLNNEKTLRSNFLFSEHTSFLHHEDEDKTLINIPYGNRQFSILMLIPNQPINEYTENLDFYQLEQWESELDTISGGLMIPSFNTSHSINLNSVFVNMGLSEIFNNTADFSRIYTDDGPFCINQYGHRAIIDFNTTNVASDKLANPADNISFRNFVSVDKPFVYFIKEKHTGTILFAGKMLNPTQ